MVCTRQIRTEQVRLDQQGLLDDEDYISRAGLPPKTAGQNVALLSSTVSAMLLTQFVSLVAAPGGTGIPGPLCFYFRGHALEHLDDQSNRNCPWEDEPGKGDRRITLTDYRHKRAEVLIERRHQRRHRLRYRFKELMLKIKAGLQWTT